MSNFLKINKGINFRPQGSEPVSPEAGDAYFDSNINTLRYFDGSQWINIGSEEAFEQVINNNQSTPENLTAALFDDSSERLAQIKYYISRQYGTMSGEDTAFYTNLGTGFGGIVFSAIEHIDNKILVSGSFTSFNSNTRNRLVRLNPDGTEDTAFYTNLGTGFGATDIRFLSVQPDGKILTPGSFTSFNSNTRNRLVRLNPDGTEDTAFYTNLGTGFGDYVWGVALQPSDDKILAVGDFTSLNSNTRNGLVRLNPDGTEDTAFYTNLGTGFGGGITRVVTVQPSDGKMLVGGGFTSFNSNTRNRLVRLNPDGTEDTAFYTNLSGAFAAGVVYGITVQSDGKIVIGGTFAAFGGNTRNGLVRLNPDGTEDTAFYTNLGTGFGGGGIRGIVLDSSEKILVHGDFTVFDGDTRNRIIRFNPDGTEDIAFYTTLGTGFDGNIVQRVSVQSDGKILANGSFTSFNGNTRNRLVRIGDSAGSSLTEAGTFDIYYDTGSGDWIISNEEYSGNDSGVEFEIDSSGQLKYTSSNIAGSEVESLIRYKLKKI